MYRNDPRTWAAIEAFAEKKSAKNFGLRWESNPGLPGGRYYQLSYKAIFWEQANFGAFLLPTEESDHYLDKMK